MKLSLQEKVRISFHKQALKHFQILLGGNVLDYSQNTHMERIVSSHISILYVWNGNVLYVFYYMSDTQTL